MAFEWGLFSEKGLQSLSDCDARINIWEGAVRSSKTITSLVAWLRYVKDGPSGDLLMAGKTERTLKRNILDPIKDMVGNKSFHYNQGAGEIKLFKRRIYVAGANDLRSEGKIRGLTLSGAYGDEFTLWPESFFKMLLSRLSTRGAQLFGTTNPDSPFHYLKSDYLDKSGLNLKSWHFTLDDNLNLDPDFVKSLKLEYTGLWHKRLISGLWVLADGAVYDMFDEDVMIVDKLPQAFQNYYVGIDYGTGNPTVFLLIGQCGNEFYVIDEYYWDSSVKGRQKTDIEYSKDLKNFVHGRYPRFIIYDPSAASFGVQLRRDGFLGLRTADNSVIDGIRTVASYFSQRRLYIYRPRCPNILSELTSYVWDSKAQLVGVDKPVKKNDHALDALRYTMHTLFNRAQISVVNKPAGW